MIPDDRYTNVHINNYFYKDQSCMCLDNPGILTMNSSELDLNCDIRSQSTQK